MIITCIGGGLGNQLFQYAFGRCAAELKHTNFKVDTSQFSKNNWKTARKFDLDKFNTQLDIATNEEIEHFKAPWETIPKLLRSIKKRIIPYYKRSLVVENFMVKFDFDANFFKIKTDCYVVGVWHSEKYFKPIQSIIRKEFTLKNEIRFTQSEAFIAISSLHNAVSIHIRRGDYVSQSEYATHHGLCTPSYYARAMAIVEKNSTTKPTWVVFSDDSRWVKENMLLLGSDVVFAADFRLADYEELILMSKCKHQIIANSSFSWWGAWLNENKEKIVVAPKNWFQDLEVSTDDLFPNNWIII